MGDAAERLDKDEAVAAVSSKFAQLGDNGPAGIEVEQRGGGAKYGLDTGELEEQRRSKSRANKITLRRGLYRELRDTRRVEGGGCTTFTFCLCHLIQSIRLLTQFKS